MLGVEQSVEVALPVEQVWAQIRDAESAAACIPGLTLRPTEDSDRYRVAMLLTFGPARAEIEGTCTITADEAHRQFTIDGQGLDKRTRTQARGAGTVVARAIADDRTSLDVSTKITVTGPIASFVESGGRAVAEAILDQFVAALHEQALGQSPGAQDTSPVDNTAHPGTVRGAPAGLSVGTLLATWLRTIRRSLSRRIRSLMAKLRGRGGRGGHHRPRPDDGGRRP